MLLSQKKSILVSIIFLLNCSMFSCNLTLEGFGDECVDIKSLKNTKISEASYLNNTQAIRPSTTAAFNHFYPSLEEAKPFFSTQKLFALRVKANLKNYDFCTSYPFLNNPYYGYVNLIFKDNLLSKKKEKDQIEDLSDEYEDMVARKVIVATRKFLNDYVLSNKTLKMILLRRVL